MKDIEIIQKCLLDKTYLDKLKLELILNQIQDKKLVKGFLTHLYIKYDSYNIDKDVPIQVMFTIFNEKSTSEELTTSNEYYNKTMRELNKLCIGKTKFLVDFLMEMSETLVGLPPDQEITENDINPLKLEEMLQSCEDKRYIEYTKNHLLENEMYEFIKIIDKYL